MNNKVNYFDLMLKIIIALLAILVIYWFLELIFGGSPELSEFNFALIILVAGLLFKIYREIGEAKIETRYIYNGTKEGFNKIKKDMSLIKKELKIK